MTPTQPNQLAAPIMDHVALAARSAWPNLYRYSFQLGGRWLAGPAVGETGDPGFFFCQLGFGGGTKIELLEPLPVPGSDFLERFLHRNGPGPHHFTFKVPDLDAVIGDLRAAGYRVVGENREDPSWQEAFLHPKQSHGIVIQVAQPNDDDFGATTRLPPSPVSASSIDFVDHLVADLDAATELFTGPLAMTLLDKGSHEGGTYNVVGSGPWRLRLIAPAEGPYTHWLGGRIGRLLQLVLSVDSTEQIGDLVPAPGEAWVLNPEHNLGTRLLLQQRTQAG